jgi:hypothetical protein
MLIDHVAVSTRGGATSTTTPSTSPTTTTPATTPPADTPATTTPPASGSRDAYGTIEAESHDSQYGTQTESSSAASGGHDVGWIAGGDWLRFSGVNFGTGNPARQFSARVAGGATGAVSGLVEVRLGSPTSSPIGRFEFANTGGWQSWRTIAANTSDVTGTHDVYLTFSSGQAADFVNVDWLTFGR